MNSATYAQRNLFRRKGRTILSLIAVAIVVLIFSLISTVLVAWNAAADEAAKDRIVTRHKVSITMQLPKRYIEEIRTVPGVKAATWASWFGAKDPKERTPFFAGFAADGNTWFEVLDEMYVEPAILEEWKKTPNGAILGDVLARTFEVKVGDRLVITSDIYPGDWEFKVVGIYKALRKTVDRNSMVFHWDYLNNDPRNEFGKDQIGWLASRIDDPSSSATISRNIDAKFEPRDEQTVTTSERAFQLGFLGAFSAILTALKIGAIVILLIMALVLANAMAMSVRERTHEYGVLRAIGFSPNSLRGFITGESMLIAGLGAALGVLLTLGLVNGMMGPFIEENMGGLFPYFRAPWSVLLLGFGITLAIGAAAAAIPAYLATRHKITDALRRLD